MVRIVPSLHASFSVSSAVPCFDTLPSTAVLVVVDFPEQVPQQTARIRFSLWEVATFFYGVTDELVLRLEDLDRSAASLAVEHVGKIDMSVENDLWYSTCEVRRRQLKHRRGNSIDACCQYLEVSDSISGTSKSLPM